MSLFNHIMGIVESMIIVLACGYYLKIFGPVWGGIMLSLSCIKYLFFWIYIYRFCNISHYAI